LASYLLFTINILQLNFFFLIASPPGEATLFLATLFKPMVFLKGKQNLKCHSCLSCCMVQAVPSSYKNLMSFSRGDVSWLNVFLKFMSLFN
jgi:hypothetical protein